MPPLDLEPPPTGPVNTSSQDTSIRFALTSLDEFADRRVATLHENSTIYIGRSSRSSPNNDGPSRISFQNPVVSRRHMCLKIILVDGQKTVGIIDENSRHGTYLGDHQLLPHKAYALISGDVVRLGNVVNKGINSHEGIALVFERLETVSGSVAPNSSYRGGFHVPSESGDSDDSEQDSNEDEEDAPSSAHTTPEQPKGHASRLQMEIIDLLGESDDDVFYVNQTPLLAGSEKAPISLDVVEPTYMVQDSFDPQAVEKRTTAGPFTTDSDCEEDENFTAIDVMQDDSDFIQDTGHDETSLPAPFVWYEEHVSNVLDDRTSPVRDSAPDDRPEVLSSRDPALLPAYSSSVAPIRATVDQAVFDDIPQDHTSFATGLAPDDGPEVLSSRSLAQQDTAKVVDPALDPEAAINVNGVGTSLEHVRSLENRARKSRWDILPAVPAMLGGQSTVNEFFPASDPESLANSPDYAYRPPHIKALLCTPEELKNSEPASLSITESVVPSQTASKKRKSDEVDETGATTLWVGSTSEPQAVQQRTSKRVKFTRSRSRVPWVSFLGGAAIGVASTFTFLSSTYCERLLEWHASL